jgi:hypothetical protein
MRTSNVPIRGSCKSLGLAAVLVVGGCSEEAPPAGAASFDGTAIRACDLLTTDEVEAAAGVAADAGEDVSQVGGRLPICHWRQAGSEYELAASVLVSISSFSTFDAFITNVRESGDDVLSEDHFERVDGIGDFAVWMPELGMLQVHDGGVMVQIDTAAPEANQLDAARTLARAALARLP